jgi:nucleoside-diphosphate-sugar epimerase
VKVLVTGGTGFTGSHTVRALVDAGHEVGLPVRDADKVRSVFEPQGFVPSDLVVSDMTDQDAVDGALVGCDAVIHTAAVVDLRRAMARRVEETNARGVELVVGGAARRGLPSIIYVSSLGVFFVPGGRHFRSTCRLRPAPPLTRARRREARFMCDGSRTKGRRSAFLTPP